MADSEMTNVWLAMMAIASVIQSLILLGAVYIAWRASRQAQQLVDRFERQQLDPLLGHVHGAVTDVRAAVARARTIEDEVRHALRATSAQMTSRVWPAIALGRAARAAFATLTRPAPARIKSTTFNSTGR
jgi:hypothetical protein